MPCMLCYIPYVCICILCARNLSFNLWFNIKHLPYILVYLVYTYICLACSLFIQICMYMLYTTYTRVAMYVCMYVHFLCQLPFIMPIIQVRSRYICMYIFMYMHVYRIFVVFLFIWFRILSPGFRMGLLNAFMPDLSNINYIHKYLKIKIHGHLQLVVFPCTIIYVYTFFFFIFALLFDFTDIFFMFLVFGFHLLICAFSDGSCAAAVAAVCIENVSKLNSFIDWDMPNGKYAKLMWA